MEGSRQRAQGNISRTAQETRDTFAVLEFTSLHFYRDSFNIVELCFDAEQRCLLRVDLSTLAMFTWAKIS